MSGSFGARPALEVEAGALFAAKLPELRTEDAEQAGRVMLQMLQENPATAERAFVAHVLTAAKGGQGWAYRLLALSLLDTLN